LGCWVGFDRRFIFLGREHVAELEEAVEILDGTAIEAFGLGLKAEKDGGDVGLADVAIEPKGERVGVVLSGTNFKALGELGMTEAVRVHGSLLEGVGEEAGLQGVETADGVLGEGDAFDGVALMGVLDFIRRSPLKIKRLHYEAVARRT
jgi:hypothetical protein